MQYLKEVPSNENGVIVRSILSDKYPLQAKLNDDDKIYEVQLQRGDEKDQLTLSSKIVSESHNNVTFKVTIHDDIYFFKTSVTAEGKKNHIQFGFPIYRLVRRKERRYLIPENWKQNAVILASNQMKLNTRARIIEISLSGMKLHAVNDLLKFEKEQIIKIQFKLHKRGEITALGIIRHIRRNRESGFTLGIEFIKNSVLVNSKITNVCEDLTFYYTSRGRLT